MTQISNGFKKDQLKLLNNSSRSQFYAQAAT